MRVMDAGIEAAAGADISCRILDSPLGALLVAGSSRGILRIAFECEGMDAVMRSLGAESSPRVLKSAELLDSVERQLEQYFAGALTRFDVKLDERASTGFRRDVLGHLIEIPYGFTRSYGEVAVAVGRPRASRAAGTACATNPWPLIVPCHRVVRSDGSIGSYLAGPPAKRYLLDLETASIPQ